MQNYLAHRTRSEFVPLRDGSMLVVRPIRRTDAPLLVDGFARLSPQSRWQRFMIGKNALTAKEVRYFTDVDHRDHEALVALDAVSGRGAGVARYVRCADDPTCADLAITVVDEWHRRGVGTELMRQLSRRAQEEGITTFSALVAVSNVAVLALLRRMDADVELVEADGQTAQYTIALRSTPLDRRAGSTAPAMCVAH
jgi:ribosomal protein S18 acetylase RimI-like enzyme